MVWTIISVESEVMISSLAFDDKTPSFSTVMVSLENLVGITKFSAQFDAGAEL